MAFLVAAVLRHEVEVVSANDNRSLHLALHHHSREDPAANRHVPSPGALLVNVVSLNRLKGLV